MEIRGTVSGTSVVAPTGTFSNGLTVSGVPVSLVSGGGGVSSIIPGTNISVVGTTTPTISTTSSVFFTSVTGTTITGTTGAFGGALSAQSGSFSSALTVSGQPVATTVDHGALTGLSDDDHTQYILANGTRAFSGNQSMGGNDLTNVDFITPVVNQVLTVSGHGTKMTSSGIDGTVIEAQGLGGLSLFARGFGELLLDAVLNLTANAGADIDIGADNDSRFAWFHADGNSGIAYITATGPAGQVNINADGAGGGVFITALGAVVGQVQVNATSQYGAVVGGVSVFTANATQLTLVVPIRNAAASAATPAYSFTGDTNTGMYREGADIVGISAGGTVRLTVSGANATTSGIGVAGNITGNRGTFGAQVIASGILAAADGSVTAPAFSFQGDPDNGMYRISANRLGFTAGGNQAIDCNGTTVNFPGFIRAADGSATSPTWGFTQDGDVGGFRVGTDVMAFSAGGTTRLTVSGANATTSGIGVAGNITGTHLTATTGAFTGLVGALNDAAAASAGVPVSGLYHTSGVIKIRLV